MNQPADKHGFSERFGSFFVHRIMAGWFMVGGTIMVLMDSIVLLPGGTVNINGTISSNLVLRLLYVIFPLFFVFIGWLVWHYKPFERFRAWMGRNLSDDPPR